MPWLAVTEDNTHTTKHLLKSLCHISVFAYTREQTNNIYINKLPLYFLNTSMATFTTTTTLAMSGLEIVVW